MLAQKLKALREKKDMSQAELANVLDVAQQTVASWEKSKSSPNYDLLQKIADFFNVSTDELLGRETKGGYYVNAETAEIANALKEGDGMLRVMFDTVRKLPPEKMREAANYIEYLKAKQHPEEE